VSHHYHDLILNPPNDDAPANETVADDGDAFSLGKIAAALHDEVERMYREAFRVRNQHRAQLERASREGNKLLVEAERQVARLRAELRATEDAGKAWMRRCLDVEAALTARMDIERAAQTDEDLIEVDNG